MQNREIEIRVLYSDEESEYFDHYAYCDNIDDAIETLIRMKKEVEENGSECDN